MGERNILPFSRRPGSHIPGVPLHYATSMELGGFAEALHVASYDGRPIKVEGNPHHPGSKGGSSAFAQASVLEIYDPDRSQGLATFSQGTETAHPWSEFYAYLEPVLAAERSAGGQGLRILAEATHSPTLESLRGRLMAAFPRAKWVEYEALSRDNERAGTALLFGAPHRSHLVLDKANVVLALDDDFLVDHPKSIAYQRDFASRRKPKEMSRFYAVESRYSTTGSNADHRLPVRSEQIKAFVLALTAEILRNPTFSAPADLASFKEAAQEGFLAEPGTSKFVHALAKDLLSNQGKSVVTAGPGQPADVHALVHQLNALLQNAGTTVLYTAEPNVERSSHHEGIVALGDEMGKGGVSTLLILGGNPVYNAPVAAKFKDGLGKVKNSIHLSLYKDETSRSCGWHLPRAHHLESWGDSRTFDGTITLQQPLIKALYGGRTFAEIAALFLGEHSRGLDLTKQTFKTAAGALALDAEKKWQQAVHDGHVAGSAHAVVSPTRRALSVQPVDAKVLTNRGENGNVEVTFWSDSHTYDGRFANNGWLQELPDFMTKLTWDNVALFGQDTAAALGVEHETLVTLQVNGVEITLPAFIMPGQAPGSVALSLGYGRSEAGHVGGTLQGGVPLTGFDTYAVWPGSKQNFAGTVTVTPTRKSFELGVTQDHHSMDDLAKNETANRVGEIVREATVEEYEKEPNFASERVEHPPLKSLWTEFTYDTGHRWGMAIDLNTCVGCNACVIACQAENNIPIVGKEQVIRGREMHWIRIDRYFTGDPSSPQVATQPMTCQQCENAPCEQVCPVGATMHSKEGLNDMVYNRCIGTRYCSNNCPYKVRRYNFFNYHKNLVDARNHVAKMVYNPEVTVRARGVMEKCTYCVQRIQNVKIVARNANRPIEDGEIVPACAQACATHAIVFGDLNDEKSAVRKLHEDSRTYAVLEQLNTKPRTRYLAKVTNPNPELS